MSATPEPAVTGTYRLQVHADFTFDDARAVVPYLAELGVSHVYLSPILTAAPGSMHGYDVIDPTSVDASRGGRDGLERLAHDAHEHGLGVIVDIVPNHMAFIAPQWLNAPVWEVLRDGKRSARAHWVDVDWDALDGQMGVPILGDTLEAELASGAITLDVGRDDEGPAAGQPVIRYYEHVFPVASGTAPSGAEVGEVLARQHYRLAYWRERDHLLNYRRFFEVDQLIGIRVEESDVFEATHRLLLDLHHQGVIDGFRVDHPDGLADPHGYLAELSRHLRPGTPVWVEKILEGDERLPSDWEASGTTGYDANAALTAALVDPGSVAALDAAWRSMEGEPELAPLVTACKRLAVEELLTPEVDRLLRRVSEIWPEADLAIVREALEHLLVAVDAYRCYIRPWHSDDPAALAMLDEAVAHAHTLVDAAALAERDDEPVHQSVDQLAHALRFPDGQVRDTAAAADLCVRFQQTTGPVMAKGIEDTAFYRWHRLTAMNEVGGDPAAAQTPGPERLHTWAQHQAQHWPMGMTTLSTHDTKRSEDVRARLLAAAGDAASWQRCTEVFAQAADRYEVDRPTAHLIWQTVLGASSEGELTLQRLQDYLLKATREAKVHTTWTAQDEAYEARVLALAEAALSEAALIEPLDAAREASAEAIRSVTLAQKVLALTLPGVPDTYQGCEIVDLSLVDPDNRRPVDYDDRRGRLERLAGGAAPADLSDEKLWVTHTLLRLRREHPQWWGPRATYEPLAVGESVAEHVIGYQRGEGVLVLAERAPHGLAAAGGWPQVDDEITVPAGRWRDALTGHEYEAAPTADLGTLHAGDVLHELPAAVLIREEK